MNISLPEGWQLMVDNGQSVEAGTILASQVPEPARKENRLEVTPIPRITAQKGGEVILGDGKIVYQI